jgi:hypothetical protein
LTITQRQTRTYGSFTRPDVGSSEPNAGASSNFTVENVQAASELPNMTHHASETSNGAVEDTESRAEMLEVERKNRPAEERREFFCN